MSSSDVGGGSPKDQRGERHRSRRAGSREPTPPLPRGYELLASLFLSALDDMGPEGTAAARRAGEEIGREHLIDRAETVEQALLRLHELGVSCRVIDDALVAGFEPLQEFPSEAPEIVRCLVAGLLQGALQGAGLRYRVEPEERVTSWSFRYRLEVS